MEIHNNIITPNCVGARLYKILGTEYPNPFCWCTIGYYDGYIKFEDLIRNYDNINFLKTNFTLEYNKELDKTSPVCIIDDKIDLHFIHYIQDETKSEPTIKKTANDSDVYYYDVLNYCKEKYYNRAHRMYNINIEPLFIITLNYIYDRITQNDCEERIKRYLELSKDKKIMVVINDDNEVYHKYKQFVNENFIMLGLTREECKLHKKSDYEKIINNILILNNHE